MTRRNQSIRRMAVVAMIAALYTAISLTLAPLSFGIVQIRFSEALGLLAVLSPVGIYGVTLGCLLSNAIGVALGGTIAADIVFGTAATLIAALLSYKLRNVRVKNIPVWSAIPPILVNGLIVGLELTYFYTPFTLPMFLMNAVSVALGQIVPCLFLGLLLVRVLERNGLAQKLFGDL